jgi:hypothetical protein
MLVGAATSMGGPWNGPVTAYRTPSRFPSDIGHILKNKQFVEVPMLVQ